MIASIQCTRWLGLSATALLVFGLVACGGGGGGAGGVVTTAAGSHPDIALRDTTGAPIMVGSTTPYSPRQTCGVCHDVDHVAEGYHFQQGRIDIQSNVQTRDNFFQDGRDFVRSDGMYGKW